MTWRVVGGGNGRSRHVEHAVRKQFGQVCTGFGMAAVLPLPTVTSAPWSLGLSLMAFGACLGSLDAAMNINAVKVERAAGRPLMSGFHALYSVGGFTGAVFMTVLPSLNFQPLHGTMLGAALMGVAMLVE